MSKFYAVGDQYKRERGKPGSMQTTTPKEARRGNPAASSPALKAKAPTHDAAWFARKVAELRAELDALPPERRALAVEALEKEEERPN